MKSGSIFLCLTISLTLALATPEVGAGGAKVERIYAGQVVILKKRPPMQFNNQGAWLSFLRSQKMTHVWPDKKQKDTWKLEFMAFFRSKPHDLEVQVKFYDVTEGKKFIAGDAMYMPQKGQAILASNIEVTKPPFAVNRNYQMFIIDGKNSKVLASTKFWLRGQEEVYSGRVDFSDDDTKGP